MSDNPEGQVEHLPATEQAATEQEADTPPAEAAHEGLVDADVPDSELPDAELPDIAPTLITTWDDYDVPDTITIQVVDDFGEQPRIYAFECKVLSYLEWERLAQGLRPAPDVVGASERGPVFSTQTPKYLDDAEMALAKIRLRRVLHSLVVQPPGNSEEEKMDYLSKRMRKGHVKALYNQLAQYHDRSESHISDLAARFHQNGA